LKRTHNLGLEGGPNFRWQYTAIVVRGMQLDKGESHAGEIDCEIESRWHPSLRII
jgi:hypothetical protein